MLPALRPWLRCGCVWWRLTAADARQLTLLSISGLAHRQDVTHTHRASNRAPPCLQSGSYNVRQTSRICVSRWVRVWRAKASLRLNHLRAPAPRYASGSAHVSGINHAFYASAITRVLQCRLRLALSECLPTLSCTILYNDMQKKPYIQARELSTSTHMRDLLIFTCIMQ